MSKACTVFATRCDMCTTCRGIARPNSSGKTCVRASSDFASWLEIFRRVFGGVLYGCSRERVSGCYRTGGSRAVDEVPMISMV